MGTPFDPSQLPSLVLWVDRRAGGFSTFNVADFESADAPHPQYLSAGASPAGWAGSAKFTLFGFVLIDPTLRGNNYALAALQSPTDGSHGFLAYRNASANTLSVKFGGAEATGSQLVMGNLEQPGTQWSGQGRIFWGFVFDGTQVGNAARLRLYVHGARDASVTYTCTVGASLAAPSGSPAFTLGYGLWDGLGARRVQLYNVAALAGYAASDAEMAALANLAAGSKYPKRWAWGSLPAGSPAAGSFTNFWALGESSTGAAPVSRADSVGGVTLTDGLGAGGNVASATTASQEDYSGHDNYGTSPTIQTGSGAATDCPQLRAAAANGNDAVHFASSVSKNSYLRYGQLGLTNVPASWTHLLVANYDFADATHEMQCCGTDVNSATVSIQASANALEPMDNDDFGATQQHPAQVAIVTGDGTNYDSYCSANNVITPGSWQVFIQRYSPNGAELTVDGAGETLADIGAIPFWAPGGGAGTNYTTPLAGTTGTMAEWSEGGVGNTDQALSNAAWMGQSAAEILCTTRVSDALKLQLETWAGLKYKAAAPFTPAAPAGLSVSAAQGQLTPSWGAVTGATSYDVLRSTVSGGETLLANVTGTSYADSAVTSGTTYYYKARALIETTAGTATGTLSAEASATAPLPPPVTDAARLWTEPPR